MTAEIDEPSYYALRVRPGADAEPWWARARADASAPAAIRALLAGRTRVELSAEEAALALAWARSVDGWDDDRPAPISVYPRAPHATELA